MMSNCENVCQLFDLLANDEQFIMALFVIEFSAASTTAMNEFICGLHFFFASATSHINMESFAETSDMIVHDEIVICHFSAIRNHISI